MKSINRSSYVRNHERLHRIQIRFAPALKKRIDARVRKEGKSFSRVVNELVEAGLKASSK